MIQIGPVTAEILLPKSLCGGGGGWWVVCKPILVFSLSLSQAEQYSIFYHILKASIIAESCEYKGKTYEHGEKMPCTDGCNTGKCWDGNVACGTEMACGVVRS